MGDPMGPYVNIKYSGSSPEASEAVTPALSTMRARWLNDTTLLNMHCHGTVMIRIPDIQMVKYKMASRIDSVFSFKNWSGIQMPFEYGTGFQVVKNKIAANHLNTGPFDNWLFSIVLNMNCCVFWPAHSVFYHFRPCECMPKHAFAGRNTQQWTCPVFGSPL